MLSLIFNGRCRLQRPRVLTGRKWFSDFVHLPLNFETPPCEHCGPCCYSKFGYGPNSVIFFFRRRRASLSKPMVKQEGNIKALAEARKNDFIQTRQAMYVST